MTHGREMGVESEIGKGDTSCFMLPIKEGVND